MRRAVQSTAFGGLVIASLALLLGGLTTTARLSASLPTVPLVGLVGLLGTAGVTGVAAREWQATFDVDRRRFGVDRTDLYAGVAVVVGGPVTYLLHASTSHGPVVASALVGLVAGLAWSDYGVPAYCGSFVGMIAPTLAGGLGAVVAASVLASLVYVLGKRVFDGFGGKLGTTAFVGCTFVVLLGGPDYPTGSIPGLTTCGGCLLAGTVGAVLAYLLSVRLDHGPVVGSAAVGLVAGLLLPVGLPAGGQLAAAAFCGSFVGMSRPDRLGGPGRVAVAGLVAGALFVTVSPSFVGSGGKLGTVAFLACLLVYAASEVAPDVVG